jgi:hypothetical protein
MLTVSIRASSLQELEALQDQAIALAQRENDAVRCNQFLNLKPNGQCLCGSGKKWKKCCMWEDRTQVTFYPLDWKHGARATLFSRMVAASFTSLAETLGG